MIQANELRPNNWLLRNDALQVQITNVGRKGTNIGPDEFPVYLEWDKFNPIPLTPEILEKCGFEYASEIVGFADKYHSIYECENGLWSFSIFCSLDADCSIIIQHLHQLQNLYFALTGEELNYTP